MVAVTDSILREARDVGAGLLPPSAGAGSWKTYQGTTEESHRRERHLARHQGPHNLASCALSLCTSYLQGFLSIVKGKFTMSDGL